MRAALLAALLALPAAADDIDAWIRDLGDDSSSKREAALDKLIEAGSSAMPRLREAAKSVDPEVQAKATYAIWRITWKEALPPSYLKANPRALDELTEGDEDVRVAAFSKVKRECRAGAIPVAVLLLESDSYRLVADALKLLMSCEQDLAAHRQGEKIARLASRLQDPDANLRLMAVRVAGAWAGSGPSDAEFGKVMTEQIVPAVLEGAVNDSEWVRATAATALGRIGGDAAIEALVKAASDPKPLVRASALLAIGELKASRGAFVAKASLVDESDDVARAALEACEKLGAKEAVGTMRDVMRREDRSPKLRQAALETLAALDPPAVEDARVLARHTSPAVAAAAWRLVLASDPAAAVEAAKREDTEVRLVAAEALARAGREAAVPVLVEMLGDGSAATVRDARGRDLVRGSVREQAIKSLEALTGKSMPGADAEERAEAWKTWWAGGGK
jgi:HEAT repeat protein